MKTKLMFLGILVLTSPYIFTQTLSKADVIGKKHSFEMIICEYSKIPDKTIDIPLSQLVESIEIIQLEASDASLVSSAWTIVSDNYILVKGQDNNPYKLFDKKGKFIAKIGSVGQGPGEYKLIYDVQIDEKNKLIYLLPWQTDKLLVFDFNGKALEPYPLATWLPKGKFNVNDDKTITLAALPFKGQTKYLVWNQTLDGKVNKAIDADKYAINPDYSNEVITGKNTGAFDFMLFLFWGENRDWFNYDYKNNILTTKLKIDFGDLKAPITIYGELPLYYTADFSDPLKQSETITVTQNHRNIIIDKKTLKGTYYKLKNDFLGNIPIGASFDNGYYTKNMSPEDLKSALEKALNEYPNMDKKIKERVSKLKNSITNNDNNYIIYGKLKR